MARRLHGAHPRGIIPILSRHHDFERFGRIFG